MDMPIYVSPELVVKILSVRMCKELEFLPLLPYIIGRQVLQ